MKTTLETTGYAKVLQTLQLFHHKMSQKFIKKKNPATN